MIVAYRQLAISVGLLPLMASHVRIFREVVRRNNGHIEPVRVAYDPLSRVLYESRTF